MSDFVELVDLAVEELGGAVLAASDEFFAPKENLLKASEPKSVPDRYTDRGKWMDGWETRRRRGPGNDWVIVRLGLPGIVRGVVIDTRHFRGNQPESCSVEVASLIGHPSIEAMSNEEVTWHQVVARSALDPHSQHQFPTQYNGRVTHVRLRIYPDGGIARLRVHGEVLPDWVRIDFRGGFVDLGALENGGRVVACSDMTFGDRQNLIMPGIARSMGDGWQTKRRRGGGNDWAIIKLGARGIVERVEVDTTHFIGNAPAAFSMDVCTTDLDMDFLTSDECPWRPLVSETPLEPNTRHLFDGKVHNAGQATHARLNIFPDGGVTRLRLWGTTAQALGIRSGLNQLNRLQPSVAEQEMLACCGSSSWAQAMVNARPFVDVASLARTADLLWTKLDKFDWLEAFAAHPRVGEDITGNDRAASWSKSEQAKVREADPDVLNPLIEVINAYYDRFGHNCVLVTGGRSAYELLAEVRRRLANVPSEEIETAAEEQRKITRLRLGKLLRALSGSS